MFSTQTHIPALVLALGLLVASAFAAPAGSVGPISDIVVTPRITSPTAETVWLAGSTQNVTWETDGIPAEAQNYTGMIVWGYESDDSENLDVANPLAEKFLLEQGWATIVVPTDPQCFDNCLVVLFGDSGNASPQFTVFPNVLQN